MGQYRLSRRIARQRYDKGIGQTIAASFYKDSERANIRLTGRQLKQNRIGLGIYLIEIRGSNKSIRFIRELREVKNPQQIYVAIPKELSNNFTYKQRVNVAITKLDRHGFFQMIKDPITRLYGLDRIEMKENKLSMQIEGKVLEFIVSNYKYQQQHEYTGAYLIFEGPIPAKHFFKILSDGYGKPKFLILFYENACRTIVGISYDPELPLFKVKYMHDKALECTKTIRLGELASDAIEVKQYIESYFQAKLKGNRNQMGAAGTAIAVKVLKDMGYKVVWADTITGTTEGPDISLFDDKGNKVTVEVKSTSNANALNFILDKAIYDIETYYFDRTHPRRKFLWHTESETLEYEADYGLAISIYLERFKETVDMKMRRIEVVISEGEVKFERSPLKKED